jgi:Flp pilus assembly protein protease CpaA
VAIALLVAAFTDIRRRQIDNRSMPSSLWACAVVLVGQRNVVVGLDVAMQFE